MTVQPLPPLTGNLHRNAGFFKTAWLPDGYPGRQEEGHICAHPLYGAYALRDYLGQLKQRPSEELREAVGRVARAALARMDSHEGALVFWYAESKDVSRAVQRHYSGLTQGYYAIHLAQAGHLLGDSELVEASERVFASLTVPVEKKGVLSPGQLGPSIAELSQEPNSYILNGWQSTLTAIVEYATLTGSDDAMHLAHQSANEMARLLPLYDAPALRNSRYGLSGFVYARLVFRGFDPASVTVRDARVATPGEPCLPVTKVGGRRWENHVLPQDVADVDSTVFRPVGNVLRLNLVLSRISFPQVNRLYCVVTSPGGVVDVQLHRGRYDPLTASQVESEWVTVARVDCPEGATILDVPLPWDAADLASYPTNFVKRIEGKPTNVYHLIHINRLRQLSEMTGVGIHAEWADTWLRYVGEWRDMGIYDGLFVSWGTKVTPVSEAGRRLPPSPARRADKE